MSMDLLTVAHPTEWAQAIERCPHDFYHSPEYHAVAEASGEGRALLLNYVEGDYSIALPLLLRSLRGVPGIRAELDRLDATSVYGYAGPVASHLSIPEPVVRNFQEALRRQLLDLGLVTVFSRLHPILTQAHLLAGLGECLLLNQTVSIDLMLPANTQREAYRRSLRTAVNRLRREGVTCERDTERAHLDAFIEIYYETMQRVGATPGYFFPRAYFHDLARMLGERFQLFVCHFEGRVVCGGIFIDCGGLIQYHLGGTPDSALELAPMKLLLDEVRLWGTQQGRTVFHLGGGTTPDPEDPLLNFKRGFSGRRHDFAVWRWVLDLAANERVCRDRSQWADENGMTAASQGFFPQYRTPLTRASPTYLAAARVSQAQGVTQ